MLTPKAERNGNIALITVVLAVLLLLIFSIPGVAHAEPVKQPEKVAQKTPPQPPKVEWMRSNEEVIKVPHGYDPETKYNPPPKDWEQAQWDPYVWA